MGLLSYQQMSQPVTTMALRKYWKSSSQKGQLPRKCTPVEKTLISPILMRKFQSMTKLLDLLYLTEIVVFQQRPKELIDKFSKNLKVTSCEITTKVDSHLSDFQDSGIKVGTIMSKMHVNRRIYNSEKLVIKSQDTYWQDQLI